MAARRYNALKYRDELIPDEFIEALAKVYTVGAEKYDVYDPDGNLIEEGADNWRDGLSWRKTLGSIYRHLRKFKNGEDFDSEYPPDILEKYGPTLHLANAAWGLATLISYYKIYPQGDDRKHKYLKSFKVGLDIDDVLAEWAPAWANYWKIPVPKSWFFDRNIKDKFDKMNSENVLNDFYLSLKPLVNPDEIPFEPHCYITSRPVSINITEEWLDRNNFPHRPVISVPLGTSKVDAVLNSKCDVFVDDRFDNFVEINKAGVCCYLFDAPHNRRYDVGYKRIKNLKELI